MHCARHTLDTVNGVSGRGSLRCGQAPPFAIYNNTYIILVVYYYTRTSYRAAPSPLCARAPLRNTPRHAHRRGWSRRRRDRARRRSLMSTVPLVPGYTCRRDGGGREESEGRGWGKREREERERRERKWVYMSYHCHRFTSLPSQINAQTTTGALHLAQRHAQSYSHTHTHTLSLSLSLSLTHTADLTNLSQAEPQQVGWSSLTNEL